jgi:hypothetical protein
MDSGADAFWLGGQPTKPIEGLSRLIIEIIIPYFKILVGELLTILCT